MSSSTISCRIFGCLLLILLSQYAEARKSFYFETILESLQRLENMLVKQAERNTFCLMPTEKLRNLIAEHQTSLESSENYIPYLAQRFIPPRKLKLYQKKNKNENENVNANINENLNTNIDTKRQHRRSFSGDSRNKNRNQNMNSNVNLNSNVNANEAFDFISDEDD